MGLLSQNKLGSSGLTEVMTGRCVGRF